MKVSFWLDIFFLVSFHLTLTIFHSEQIMRVVTEHRKLRIRKTKCVNIGSMHGNLLFIYLVFIIHIFIFVQPDLYRNNSTCKVLSNASIDYLFFDITGKICQPNICRGCGCSERQCIDTDVCFGSSL